MVSERIKKYLISVLTSTEDDDPVFYWRNYDYVYDMWECPFCEQYSPIKSKYCPNCGKLMEVDNIYE